jgi:hypothetical protein
MQGTETKEKEVRKCYIAQESTRHEKSCYAINFIHLNSFQSMLHSFTLHLKQESSLIARLLGKAPMQL